MRNSDFAMYCGDGGDADPSGLTTSHGERALIFGAPLTYIYWLNFRNKSENVRFAFGPTTEPDNGSGDLKHAEIDPKKTKPLIEGKYSRVFNFYVAA